jgi:hypothetical protein
VLVRPEDHATAAELMQAVGTLSNDGKCFSVIVTREDGTQEIQDLSYKDLLKVLSATSFLLCLLPTATTNDKSHTISCTNF